MGVPTSVRHAVYARDGMQCCRCRQHLVSPTLHHRQPRGMGGSSSGLIHLPSNLVTACWRCHLQWAEVRRAEAQRLGWLVPHPLVPFEVPILRFGELVYLDDEYRVQAA